MSLSNPFLPCRRRSLSHPTNHQCFSHLHQHNNLFLVPIFHLKIPSTSDQILVIFYHNYTHPWGSLFFLFWVTSCFWRKDKAFLQESPTSMMMCLSSISPPFPLGAGALEVFCVRCSLLTQTLAHSWILACHASSLFLKKLHYFWKILSISWTNWVITHNLDNVKGRGTCGIR